MLLATIHATEGLLWFALLTLAMAALGYVLCERLVRSPYGRLLKAMRENDRVTQGLGKPVARVRAEVMAIGSAMARRKLGQIARA